jgi:cytochrome c oxidase assembly protein subunit 11
MKKMKKKTRAKTPASGKVIPPLAPRVRLLNRHQAVALSCAVFVVAMVGAAYAAVPLYNWFCRTTGFGGTPLVAEEAPSAPISRKITVRFDGNVADGLPWTFGPDQPSITINIGQTTLFHYTAKSFARTETEGIASYNISPPEAAGYFNKLQCFCFTNQKLSPGEKMDMPVVFFVDPAIDKDPQFRSLDTITLSYTFFPARKPANSVSAVEGNKLR